MRNQALNLQAQVESLIDNIDPSDGLYLEECEGPTAQNIIEWATYVLEAVNSHIEAGNIVPRKKGDTQ